jgi:glucose/mannose transport system permease protein
MNNVRRALPNTPAQWVIFIILVAVMVFYLMPIYVMLVNGLKEAQNVSLSTMWQLPAAFTGGGFREAWQRLSPNMANSLLMVIPATVLSSFIGSINGYLFSKWKFRGSDLIFTLILFGMFIPYQSVLIPLIRFLQGVGLYGKVGGLIAVHVIYGIPITTLIFRNYYANIPNEILEASRMDGAGVMTTYWRVMLPLSPPAFVVVGIFQFTNIWNDFLFGVTIVQNPQAQPVTIALNNLSGSFSVDWNVVMAGAVIAALPTALIYIALGRYFIRGLTAGSVKG